MRRDEGRRRRQRLIGLAVFLAVASLLAGLTRSPVLDIDRVSVVGAEHTQPVAIARVAGLRRGQAMVDVDGGAAARAIRTLPWVHDASVQRLWPGTVRVRIVERRAVAQLRHRGGGWAAVDASGRVLRTARTPLSGLVRIDPLMASDPGTSLGPPARAALGLAAALGPTLEAGVATIVIGGGELTMRLVEDAILVRFGPPTEVAAKVEALAALLASAVRTPTIKTIDVSVPSASVLTREQPRA